MKIVVDKKITIITEEKETKESIELLKKVLEQLVSSSGERRDCIDCDGPF
jgi:hypothetical protein